MLFEFHGFSGQYPCLLGEFPEAYRVKKLMIKVVVRNRSNNRANRTDVSGTIAGTVNESSNKETSLGNFRPQTPSEIFMGNMNAG